MNLTVGKKSKQNQAMEIIPREWPGELAIKVVNISVHRENN